uniref:Cation/H+ exchanger transmembrane domain-containing protein n=1 Tax=Phytophthora ramorum TaxID=164328 RepID=H3H7P2_PHYRM
MPPRHTPAYARQLLALLVVVAAHLASGQATVREGKSPESIDRRLSGGAAEDPDKTVPFNSWGNIIETLRYGLAFVIVLVAAHPLGLFFPKFFKLPLITGYLVIGIIAGPFVANLLTEDLVNMLSNYVSALALSFISFQAGQEIYLPELRPQLKAIFILLGTLYVTAMVLLTSVHLMVESAFFYDELALSCQLGIALMFGSISVLGSPATVMAIKIELNSVGPFTSLMLGATMTAEFVVLVSFSVSRIVCSIYCAELDVSMGNLMFTLSIVIVVNHHSVDYDRLMETLAAENLPMPPPPSRVAMFGTSAAGFDPFSSRDNGSSFFVMHDDPEQGEEVVLSTPYGSSRSHRRISLSRTSRHSTLSISSDVRQRSGVTKL